MQQLLVVMQQSESGVAPPDIPLTRSTELQAVDQIKKQSEDFTEESYAVADSLWPADMHDSGTTNLESHPVDGSESLSDDEGVGQKKHEQWVGVITDDSSDICIAERAKSLSGRHSEEPGSHEGDSETVSHEDQSETVSHEDQPIVKQTEDKLISSTTVASVSTLVVQSQQVEVDETSISTVSAGSSSIQSVDAEFEEHDAGFSVPSSDKPLTGKAGFIKRWFSKAVSWIKRFVGF